MKRKKLFYSLIFVVSGGIIGYLYWFFVGCKSGVCPITSKWFNTTLYGAFLGYLLGTSIFDFIYKNKKVKND